MMCTRKEIISSFYEQADEDGRLRKNRHGDEKRQSLAGRADRRSRGAVRTRSEKPGAAAEQA